MGKTMLDHGLGHNEVLHAFPLNGNFESPEIHGIDGVLAEYEENINRIRMAGPTLFSEVLEAFTSLAEAGREADSKSYFVLLMITDGTIHDLEETTRLIVKLSDLPCSLVIVGVGDGDFSQMEFLDSDDKMLKDKKKNKAKRDIVQFVPLTRAKAMGNLQEEVMREIPEQVC